jgi:hypothetical protein
MILDISFFCWYKAYKIYERSCADENNHATKVLLFLGTAGILQYAVVCRVTTIMLLQITNIFLSLLCVIKWQSLTEITPIMIKI